MTTLHAREFGTTAAVVDAAISDSISKSEIISIIPGGDEQGLLDELAARADDSADNGGEVEFWGDDDDDAARQWQVHVILSAEFTHKASAKIAAERKRKQRARLDEQGLAQYTVTWPVHLLEQLRELETDQLARHNRLLVDGGWPYETAAAIVARSR